MVHELVALLVLEPLEHREIDDPEELEAIRIEQVQLLRDVQAQLPERGAGLVMLATGHDQEILGAAGGRVERRPDGLFTGGLERGTLRRAFRPPCPHQARRPELLRQVAQLVELAA